MKLSTEYKVTDRFDWKGISLYQDDRVLKVGTDALLLATWVPTILQHPSFILDVETGSGILSLLMAQSYPQSSILAIDPEESAAQLARINVGLSDHQTRIQVDQTGLLELASSTPQRFDLIISNPPFYVNHILPSSAVMQTSKHNVLTPALWMKAISHLLKLNGSVCLVVPTQVSFEWIREANANELFCSQRLDVFSFSTDMVSKRSLLCLSHELGKPTFKQMTMYKAEKVYTNEYAAWLGI